MCKRQCLLDSLTMQMPLPFGEAYRANATAFWPSLPCKRHRLFPANASLCCARHRQRPPAEGKNMPPHTAAYHRTVKKHSKPSYDHIPQHTTARSHSTADHHMFPQHTTRSHTTANHRMITYHIRRSHTTADDRMITNMQAHAHTHTHTHTHTQPRPATRNIVVLPVGTVPQPILVHFSLTRVVPRWKVEGSVWVAHCAGMHGGRQTG